jgi:hypothetical protein
MRGPRFLPALAVLFWGISFVATKAALAEVAPVTLVFLRFAIAAIVLFAIVRELPPRHAWPSLALMGFVGVFVHQMLQSYALTMTTATTTGWLIGVTPIWSALLSAFVLRERFQLLEGLRPHGRLRRRAARRDEGRLQSELFGRPSTTGDLLILLSTVNWAVYSILGRNTIRTLGPRRATFGSMLFARDARAVLHRTKRLAADPEPLADGLDRSVVPRALLLRARIPLLVRSAGTDRSVARRGAALRRTARDLRRRCATPW